ncbi:iron chelate uptake ABC transporter family permease subunit [Azospirillum brasilense]|nr:iron chelate uptake ABC transporter family permease subunit [Azospirillum brasilense]
MMSGVATFARTGELAKLAWSAGTPAAPPELQWPSHPPGRGGRGGEPQRVATAARALALATGSGTSCVPVVPAALLVGPGLAASGAADQGAFPNPLVAPETLGVLSVAALGAVALSALFGAAWGAVPGWLQAKRGSHIVITTIMFNFIAAAIMTYLLVDVLIRPGSQSPETREFDPGVWLPTMDRALGWIGVAIPASPLNLSFLWALACCALFYLFLWRTRWGYEIRTVGRNERAAVYAGISPARNIILAMAISGALAGFVGVNEIMGVQHRILLNFTGGVGFVGIAVALMGRNHPVGIILAALLFGVLAQGGGQVSFEYPTVNRELVMVIQGLVILFAGALENLFKPRVEALFRRRGGGHDGGTAHG